MLALLATMFGALWIGVAAAMVYLVGSYVLERPLAELRHRLAHRFGRNVGHLVTWHGRDGRLMVASFCDGCARVCGMHAMPDYLQDPAARGTTRSSR
jgi:hypothetical protein